MGGMEKTTVYVPTDLKQAMARAAAAEGLSQAAWMRNTLRQASSRAAPPAPRLPLIESGKPRLAEQIDQALEGFGSP